MTATVDALIAAFVYISTAIATLRAGSRALYITKHNGAIGIMDGPLILGPEDILKLQKKSEGDVDGIEVSKLWESTYGFQKAVKLSLLDKISSPRGSSSATLEELFNVVTVGDIGVESRKRGYYSFASPHKLFPVEDNLSKDEEDSLKEINDEIDGKVSESMESTTFWFRGIHALQTALLPRISRLQPPAPPVNMQSGMINSDPISIQSLHHSLMNNNAKNDKYSSKQDEGECDDKVLDCSTVLSSIIPIPTTPPEDTDFYNKQSDARDDTAHPQRVAQIKAYAPNVFTTLRSRFGIEEDDFVKSIIGSGPYVSFQSSSKGAARSGGYFFFTRDGAYMVKTIKKAEVAAFLNSLPKYHKYMMRHARGSLISRCFGIYGVQISDSAHQVGHSWLEENEDVFIITNSVFPAENSQFISERFDLKGSTVGRVCSKEERGEKGCNAILKDLDLAREFEVLHALFPLSRPRKCGINIGSRAKAALLTQLRRDTEFLVDCGVMDYSLLVGVINMDRIGREVDLDTCLSNMALKDTALCEASLQSQKQRALLSRLTIPMRQLFAPPLFIVKQCYNVFDSILMSILTLPLPYYGAGMCGVNGGSHSIIPGYRFGNKAVYYLGVIDFLQPWTFRKYMEREVRGAIGFDKKAISCVHPKDYAIRFLAFLDQHII